MRTNKCCIRCGRRLYVNDYCKPCTRELRNERLVQFYKEHPDNKYSADFWKDIERIQLEYRRKQIQLKRSLEYNYRIAARLRSVVRILLKSKSLKSMNTYNDLISCSPNDLIMHLENKFTPGMSWGNYGLGGWHIDHILPCAVFNLQDPVEQKKCFHYSNLEPMWATDNFDKKVYCNSTFQSLDLLNQFINTHKIPASAKMVIKTDKAGKTKYRIKFKLH